MINGVESFLKIYIWKSQARSNWKVVYFSPKPVEQQTSTEIT